MNIDKHREHDRHIRNVEAIDKHREHDRHIRNVEADIALFIASSQQHFAWIVLILVVRMNTLSVPHNARTHPHITRFVPSTVSISSLRCIIP